MRLFHAIFVAAVLPVDFADAQISMSDGIYRQDFDSLASSGSANGWADDSTLPGWYASRKISPDAVTNYIANTGSLTTGSLYSYGVAASTNRALGVLVSSTSGNMAFGLRFTNDTAFAQSNILISFAGEQWRNANAATQALAFSYQTGTSLTDADGAGEFVWTPFAALNFTTPVAVPNWPLPLHVFVAHLKFTGNSNPQDDANKRAAEASVVSNYFAATFLTSTNANHPYILAGDMNEDAFFPDSDYVSGHPIQRLTSAPTGL